MSSFTLPTCSTSLQWQLCPRLYWGSLQCSPRSIAGFKEPTSKWMGGEARKRGGDIGGRKRKGGKGKGEGVRAWMFFTNISPCSQP